MTKVSLAILTSLFAVGFSAYAQNITGSMTGRIVDQQGSAIPKATVSAIEPSKKVNITTQTTDQGEFSLAGLLPGNYTLVSCPTNRFI